MRTAVITRSVPCRPVHIILFLHLLLRNIVILNEINGDNYCITFTGYIIKEK